MFIKFPPTREVLAICKSHNPKALVYFDMLDNAGAIATALGLTPRRSNLEVHRAMLNVAAVLTQSFAVQHRMQASGYPTKVSRARQLMER